MIKFLKRDSIDLVKWDECIRTAQNGRIYALSYYLDLVCNKGGWNALVEGDYAAVMPLPLNNKIPFFSRITLPLFAQQLGVFTNKSIDDQLMSDFISAIPLSYRSVYLQLNDSNLIAEAFKLDIRTRNNFTLSLEKPYNDLYTAYSKNIKRNIKAAAKHQLSISSIDAAQFCTFYLAHSEKETIAKTQVNIFLPSLIGNIIDKEHGRIWGVKNEDENILAACLVTNFNGRLTYLLARSSEEGKSKSAMHFIIDAAIKENADTKILLDFEGSDIKSVARFFQSFGASNEPYPILSYARFPFKRV